MSYSDSEADLEYSREERSRSPSRSSSLSTSRSRSRSRSRSTSPSQSPPRGRKAPPPRRRSWSTSKEVPRRSFTTPPRRPQGRSPVRVQRVARSEGNDDSSYEQRRSRPRGRLLPPTRERIKRYRLEIERKQREWDERVRALEALDRQARRIAFEQRLRAQHDEAELRKREMEQRRRKQQKREEQQRARDAERRAEIERRRREREAAKKQETAARASKIAKIKPKHTHAPPSQSPNNLAPPPNEPSDQTPPRKPPVPRFARHNPSKQSKMAVEAEINTGDTTNARNPPMRMVKNTLAKAPTAHAKNPKPVVIRKPPSADNDKRTAIKRKQQKPRTRPRSAEQPRKPSKRRSSAVASDSEVHSSTESSESQSGSDLEGRTTEYVNRKQSRTAAVSESDQSRNSNSQEEEAIDDIKPAAKDARKVPRNPPRNAKDEPNNPTKPPPTPPFLKKKIVLNPWQPATEVAEPPPAAAKQGEKSLPPWMKKPLGFKLQQPTEPSLPHNLKMPDQIPEDQEIVEETPMAAQAENNSRNTILPMPAEVPPSKPVAATVEKVPPPFLKPPKPLAGPLESKSTVLPTVTLPTNITPVVPNKQMPLPTAPAAPPGVNSRLAAGTESAPQWLKATNAPVVDDLFGQERIQSHAKTMPQPMAKQPSVPTVAANPAVSDDIFSEENPSANKVPRRRATVQAPSLLAPPVGSTAIATHQRRLSDGAIDSLRQEAKIGVTKRNNNALPPTPSPPQMAGKEQAPSGLAVDKPSVQPRRAPRAKTTDDIFGDDNDRPAVLDTKPAIAKPIAAAPSINVKTVPEPKLEPRVAAPAAPAKANGASGEHQPGWLANIQQPQSLHCDMDL